MIKLNLLCYNRIILFSYFWNYSACFVITHLLVLKKNTVQFNHILGRVVCDMKNRNDGFINRRKMKEINMIVIMRRTKQWFQVS